MSDIKSSLLRAAVIREIRQPETISFTDFDRSNNCALSSWPRSHLTCDFDSRAHSFSRPRIIGEFFHKLLEEISTLDHQPLDSATKNLEDKYYDLLDSFRARYSNLLAENNEDLDYWGELSEAHRSAEQALIRQRSLSAKTFREYRSERQSLGIKGVIDEVNVFDDRIVITEYKSIYSLDDEMIERYRTQLMFYALLLEEEYEIQMTGVIRGFGELAVKVSWTSAEKESVRAFVAEYKRKCSLKGLALVDEIKGLASVSRSSCTSCRIRSGCPALREPNLSKFGDGYELGVVKVKTSHVKPLAEVVGGTISPGVYEIEQWDAPEISSRNETIILDRLTFKGNKLSLTKHSQVRLVQ